MGYTYAYGTAMDDKAAERAIAAALDMGRTFFDSAECCIGSHADSSTARNEDLVGKALKPYRSRVVITSKRGVHHNSQGTPEMDSRPEVI